MTITTYDELKTALQSWLARSDADLVAEIDTFIDIAEAGFSREFRVQEMESETTISTTASTSTVSLPSDFRGFASLAFQTTPKQIDKTTQTKINDTFAGSTNGQPKQYALYPGKKVVFGPTPDAVYTLDLIYYQTIPALTDSNTTNWLLDIASDLYLYASMVAAKGYMQDPPNMAFWESEKTRIIKEVKDEDKMRAATKGAMKVKPSNSGP